MRITHLHRITLPHFTLLSCKFRLFKLWFAVINSKPSGMPAPLSQPQVDLASEFAGNAVVVGPGTMVSQIHTMRTWMEISIPNTASEMDPSLCFDVWEGAEDGNLVKLWGLSALDLTDTLNDLALGRHGISWRRYWKPYHYISVKGTHDYSRRCNSKYCFESSRGFCYGPTQRDNEDTLVSRLALRRRPQIQSNINFRTHPKNIIRRSERRLVPLRNIDKTWARLIQSTDFTSFSVKKDGFNASTSLRLMTTIPQSACFMSVVILMGLEFSCRSFNPIDYHISMRNSKCKICHGWSTWIFCLKIQSAFDLSSW